MKNGKNILTLSLFGLILLIAMGANGPCDPIDPPYDATGFYTGEWWSGEGERCPIDATFTMDATPVNPPLWAPQAGFTIDFSCLELPEWVPPLEPILINAAGLLDGNGIMTFASGGCGTPFCILFATTGQGEDVDLDGMMDTYVGEWSLTILLAGFQPFGVAGEFDLGRIVPDTSTVEME